MIEGVFLLIMYIKYLKAKIISLIFGYIYEIIFCVLLLIALLSRDLMSIAGSFVAVFIVKKIMCVASFGCLHIVRTTRKYEISMRGSILKKNKVGVLKYFEQSFIGIFNNKTIKKIKAPHIVVNTHTTLIRGVVKILRGNRYTVPELNKDVLKGYITIGDYKLPIVKKRDRKNHMLAAVYPLRPSKQQLKEFESTYKDIPFYELCIPIGIIKELNSKNNGNKS